MGTRIIVSGWLDEMAWNVTSDKVANIKEFNSNQEESNTRLVRNPSCKLNNFCVLTTT